MPVLLRLPFDGVFAVNSHVYLDNNYRVRWQNSAGTSTGDGSIYQSDTDEVVIECGIASTFVVESNNGGAQILRTTENGLTLPGSAGEGRFINIGSGRAGDGNSYIDLVGDDTYSSYGLRLRRFPGASGRSEIEHRGAGEFQVRTVEGSPFQVQIGSSDVFEVYGNEVRANASLKLNPHGVEGGELVFTDKDGNADFIFDVDANNNLRVRQAGNVVFNISATGRLSMPAIPEFSSHAAAGAGGLNLGEFYVNTTTGALTKRRP